ncbi:hypothetical protein F2P56_031895 [Juglans regia]|uniref:Ubiquitin thioesterase OTU n=2 Tax=Juglans regia TaxID=51240 RepID=A0A833WUJ1_JUGRE|nr:uncharacterized protein LOC109015472 [Juglans regia]KAF5446257.1 hypothetical protein F2P56_031895 [Juglans regia]
MLAVLCVRPKPWILSSSSSVHGSQAHHYPYSSRIRRSPIHFVGFRGDRQPRRHHSNACRLEGSFGGGAASIWHAIMPCGAAGIPSDLLLRRKAMLRRERSGEGSWNAAWDARPARWLHLPDSARLLFGVCACLTPLDLAIDGNPEAAVLEEKIEACDSIDLNACKINELVGRDVIDSNANKNSDGSADYRVTGVLADGRCLFRALAHGACLRIGEEAPDENRQRELADELRAQVVDELLKRRKETEWFIEGDFDAYVKRIQQPYVWGGEPELLMASHVLKTPISVFMLNRSSGGLVNIAKYGEEYQKDEESLINVLFHGYGHYDLLESFSEDTCLK